GNRQHVERRSAPRVGLCRNSADPVLSKAAEVFLSDERLNASLRAAVFPKTRHIAIELRVAQIARPDEASRPLAGPRLQDPRLLQQFPIARDGLVAVIGALRHFECDLRGAQVRGIAEDKLL